jgi:hypothetical protein
VTHSFARTLVLAGALIGAATTHAAAQDGLIRPSRSLVPVAFPRWDAGGSIGMLNISGADTRSSWAAWEQKGEFRVDVGRYWTTHLKTEVAFSTTNPWTDYESERIVVPGSTTPGYAYLDIDRHLYTVAPALTWQFRENTFMHPFVSGGVNIGVLDEHRVRESNAYRPRTGSFVVPPLDERRTVVMARPFVAGGFKSYISRAVYVRSELRAAFAQDGLRQLAVLAGIGVDF